MKAVEGGRGTAWQMKANMIKLGGDLFENLGSRSFVDCLCGHAQR